MDDIFDSAPSGDETPTNSEVNTEINPDIEGLVEMTTMEDREAEQAPVKRKFKLKVDDQEIEEEYSDEDLVRELQMARSATKRFQDASELKRQNQEILRLMKSDPAALFRHVGYKPEDIVNWADQVLGAHLEQAGLSPEERARREEEQELKQLREERRRQQEEATKAQAAQQKAQIREQLEGQLVDAMLTAGLPNDPMVRNIIMMDALKMYAADKVQALKNGVQPSMTPAKAVQRAKEARIRDQKNLLSKYSDEQLYDTLGEDMIKRIRKVDTARHSTKKIPTNHNSANTAPRVKIAEEKTVISPDEFEQYLKDLSKK